MKHVHIKPLICKIVRQYGTAIYMTYVNAILIFGVSQVVAKFVLQTYNKQKSLMKNSMKLWLNVAIIVVTGKMLGQFPSHIPNPFRSQNFDPMTVPESMAFPLTGLV